jgi:Syd protein (SUKH-2)
MTTSSLHDAQDRFFRRYLDAVEAATGALPLAEDDADRPSECFVGEEDERGLRPWRPLLRGETVVDLSALETALGTAIHADLRAWFSRWQSMPIEGTWGEETVVLGLAPSEADLAELLHAAANGLCPHGREREPAVPVAVLHDGRRIRVGNVTGRVWFLVRDGREILIAPSLSAFLDGVVPLPL